jgi:hypothetical protein
MPHTRLTARLKAITAVTDLVGARIWPVDRRQGTELPAITYERITRTELNHATGTTNTSRVRIELNCWASSYAGAHALAAAVRGNGAADSPTGIAGWTDGNGNGWHIVLGPMDAPAAWLPGQDARTAHCVSMHVVTWYTET